MANLINIDGLREVMGEHIKLRVEQIMEEEMKSLRPRIEQRVRGEIGMIATEVLSRASFEMPFRNELVIRVDIRKEGE